MFSLRLNGLLLRSLVDFALRLKSKIMGRPTLQEEEKRVIQVNIRLTKDENDTVLNYAEASGMTPANWIRQKAFTGRFPIIP
jgi:hypothetical protein